MDIINPMDIMRPINLSAKELDESNPFTVVERGNFGLPILEIVCLNKF
jgi:hypothetical protein